MRLPTTSGQAYERASADEVEGRQKPWSGCASGAPTGGLRTPCPPAPSGNVSRHLAVHLLTTGARAPKPKEHQ